MDKTYNIALNMNKSVPVLTGITLCQGDKGIKLLINIVGFQLATDMTAKVIFLKPDNTCVEGDTTNTVMSVSDNTVTYTIAGNEIAAPGVVIADVKFYDSANNRISSASIVFDVTSDTLKDDAILSTTYVSRVEEAIEACENASKSLVANNLTTTDAGYALDARQGKVLKELIDAIDTSGGDIEIQDGTITYAMLATALQTLIDGKLNASNVVNNVTTTDTGYALDARQGTALKALIDGLPSITIIDSITIATTDWTSSTYTITNSAIKADSVIDIYYASASQEAMSEALPSYTQTAGQIVIAVENALTSSITIEAIKVVD